MHSALQKKLKSESGISMTLALIFFLLCVAVSGIIMTAATASAGVAIGNLQTQRGYLAVASAARLVMNDLEGLDYNEVYSGDGGFTGSTLIPDSKSPVQRFTWADDHTTVTAKDDAAELSYALSFPELEEEGIPAVKGEIVIGADFGITVALTDGEEIGKGDSEMTIHYIPVIIQPVMTTTNTYSGASETAATKYTASVHWGQPIVSGMEATT